MSQKFIHKKTMAFLRRLISLYRVYSMYVFDAKRYIKHSSLEKIDNEKKLIGKIIEKYHAVEKGLVMPNMRYGFGKELMIALINDCVEFASKNNAAHPQLCQAIGVIQEYKRAHDENNEKIDVALNNKIEELLSICPKNSRVEQITKTKKQFFQFKESSFPKFAESRYSLRNFSGTVSLEQITNSIQLAQNAPSACNRQPVRITIIESKSKIKEVLSLQTGNRGFGHLADKLLIITSELGGYSGLRERNLAYIDAGIYTMNLLYALHYYEIGACTLNWCDEKNTDKALRETINIPQSETVVVFILCGGVPENFKLTVSKRNSSNMITRII